MGQMANGILYGCECPELPGSQDDEPLYDLICRWEKSQGIDWLDRGQLHVSSETHGKKDLIGVWVACGGSGKDGAPHFTNEAMTLGRVKDVYAESIAKAGKLWAKFAIWVFKNEKINLPAPDLWLTPCETA